MILVERISLIVVQIKTPKHEEIISKIYWNQANLTGDAAGETYAFVYAIPACVVIKSYAPFSKRQSWFLLLFKLLILV